MAVITLTGATFKEEVMNSDKPVLIDFGQPGAARAECFRPSLTKWQRKRIPLRFARLMLMKRHSLPPCSALRLFPR